MNKLFKVLVTLLTIILSFNGYADVVDADQRMIYIGGEAGIAEPILAKFKHKSSGTEIRLKRSAMYSGKIGYSFYPQMYLEFSGTHQPRYKLHYKLPNPEKPIPGDTKVVSNIYMINFIYDFQKLGPVIPFFIGGVGIAQLTVKPTLTKDPIYGIEIFKINKTKTNCFAWQAGLGLSFEIAENLTIDGTAKLQVAQNAKIKYDKLNILTQKFETQSPIKKTIGAGEFGIGFTYKLPI